MQLKHNFAQFAQRQGQLRGPDNFTLSLHIWGNIKENDRRAFLRAWLVDDESAWAHNTALRF